MIKKLITAFYSRCLIVTVTPYVLSALRRRGLTDVRLIPNGADVKVFRPLGSKRSGGNFIILHCGGIGSYYRVDVVVKALKRLADMGVDNIKLVIVGVGDFRSVINLAKKLNIRDKVIYRGAIYDRAKLAALISKADVGLIPYDKNPLWKNALPAKFFEYCACEVPVIATAYKDSLLAKLIRKYKIGLISPPMDEKKLAEVIYKLYRDDKFRMEAGKRARLLVERIFSREKSSKRFLALLESLTRSMNQRGLS